MQPGKNLSYRPHLYNWISHPYISSHLYEKHLIFSFSISLYQQPFKCKALDIQFLIQGGLYQTEGCSADLPLTEIIVVSQKNQTWINWYTKHLYFNDDCLSVETWCSFQSEPLQKETKNNFQDFLLFIKLSTAKVPIVTLGRKSVKFVPSFRRLWSCNANCAVVKPRG